MKLLTKITAILLVVLLTILSIFAIEQINKEKKVLNFFLIKQVETLKSTISAGILEPVLIDDYPVLDTYLGNIISNDEMIYYIFIEKDGEIISSVRNSKLKNDNIKKFTHNIKLYGNTVAKLELAISTKYTDEIVSARTDEFLFVIFIVSLFLFFSLLYIIKKYLLQYINKLKEHTSIIGSGIYNKELLIKTNDEFQDLAKSINDMTNNIYLSSQKSMELTQKLEKQKEELIFANKAKDKFLANMSHELKTPLNSINIISSVMKKNKENNLNNTQLRNISIINMCGQNLLYLINDILDISELESGEIKLNYETFSLYELLKNLKLMIEPQINIDKIKFEFEYDKNIDEYIHSDKVRINQIIKNFLSNAIKFCEEGSIKLKVLDDNDFINISVQDDGIGIEKTKLNNIFDRFKQIDDEINRRYTGSGLGLSISKELTKLLNGEIFVESKVGIGSTFTLKIPKNKDKIKIEELKAISTTKKEKILILTNNISEIMSFVIKLKKNFEVDIILNESQFKEKKNNGYDFMIIDDSLLDLKHLDGLNSQIIVICDNKEKINNTNHNYKKVLEKPFDMEILESHFFN